MTDNCSRIIGFVPVTVWFVIMTWLDVTLLEMGCFLGLVSVLFVLPGIAVESIRCASSGPISVLNVLAIGTTISTTLFALIGWCGFSSMIAIAPTLLMAFVGLAMLPRFFQRASLDKNAWLVGWAVVFCAGAATFASGRLQDGNLVFFGGLGRDPVFHLSIIGRLQSIMIPDNWLVSGYPFSYHYLPDLAQAMLLRFANGALDTNDLYYRLYVSFVYFNIGAAVYSVCIRIVSVVWVAVIGTALIVFSPDLSGMISCAQALRHLGDDGFWSRFFEPWVGWSSTGGMLPLFHRPAYYHGMWLFFAGLSNLTRSDQLSRGNWMAASLIWGLMAGFNYTFAGLVGVTLGAMFIAGSKYCAIDRKTILLSGLVLAFASLPFNCILHLTPNAGQHTGFQFSIAENCVQTYSSLLAPISNEFLRRVLAVSLFLLLGHGIRLLGLRELFAESSEFRRYPGVHALVSVATYLHLAFYLAVYSQLDGVADNAMIMIAQPITWTLGLLSLIGLSSLLTHGKFRKIKVIVVATVILLPPLQIVLATNLNYYTAVSKDEVTALAFIRSKANENDVVAFNVRERTAVSIFGITSNVHNFYVPAITGLRGYFTSPSYSLRQVVNTQDGISDLDQRVAAVEHFTTADERMQQSLNRFREDGVKWLLINEIDPPAASSDMRVLREGDWSVYELQAGGAESRYTTEPTKP